MPEVVIHRDLLPLRLPEVAGGFEQPRLGRGTRQRIRRRMEADAWAHEGVQTLNDLYGKPEGVKGPAPVGSHAAALSNLEQRYRRMGTPTSRPEEALTALLGSMAGYGTLDVECTTRASFDEALVSWPALGSHPVKVASLLGEDSKKLLTLEGASELIADAEAVGNSECVKPYIDPVLANSPVHMGRFLARLFKCRMLQLIPGRREHTVGVFFVLKKSGKLRLILDTRKANTYFRKPRASHLPTPAAWTSIEVAPDDTLYTARMELPPHLRQYFRLPAIKCRFLDKDMWPQGCGPEDFVTPEYATLPMGWNWSLYFCQSLLESAAAQAGLAEEDRVEDRTWTGKVSGDRIVHAQYVDNFFCSGTSAENVQVAFDRLKDTLEGWGFEIHEVSEAQTVVQGLGLVIDGEQKCVSLSTARIWKLRLASLALCNRCKPPEPKVIEKIVGHFTFAMMIRRETLSVFSEVYRYMRCERPSSRMWAAARKEIRQASSLLPLMSTPFDLPWSTTVLATDSSEVGYGVCAREVCSKLVTATARTSEKWRYAVEGAVKARASALGLDPGGSHEGSLHDECARVVQAEFKEVCPSILDPSKWHVLFRGAWTYSENILRTEGRAMLSGVRHLLRTRRCAGQRYLLLVDNLSLALACCKGRGGSMLANSTCRQLAALSLAGNCKFHVRWIPSERTLQLTVPAHAPAKLRGEKRRLTGPPNQGTAATLAGTPSHLELHKVRRTATQDRYNTTVNAFLQWCLAYFHLSQDWDRLLTAYINELFAQEADVSAAEYVFASFRYRTIQALEGFRNLAPPKMRLPTPRVAFAAVVGVFLARSLVEMALALLLQWDLLLRPGELVGLRPQQIVRPADLAAMRSWGVILAPSDGGSSEPSKTNAFDESILLSPRINHLLPSLAALLLRRQQSHFLFPFTCSQLADEFKQAMEVLSLQGLNATLYGNRHGAASGLRLEGVPLAEIKRRGRWLADSSVKRYEKATVAQQQVHKIPIPVQIYGAFVEQELVRSAGLMEQALKGPSRPA
ncbi:DEK1, partial [Symbiodinium sp. CCMP2592]